MNLQIESSGEARIVRVKEPRLIFPLLKDFFARLQELVDGGTRHIVMDLSGVSYLDSASYGCLMDVHRLMTERNGTLKLFGLQERVESMGNLVGLTRIIETFHEEGPALESLGERGARRPG